MRLMPYLCLDSVELANLARVTTYGDCGFFDGACPCDVLDEVTYVSPADDPAPWYDATYPESADFLGLLPQSITLSPASSRSVTATRREGSFIAPEGLPGRVVEVTAWMLANDLQSMWYGERWLTEALRGSQCASCRGDVLQVLPFCRQAGGSIDLNDDFRTLVGAGLVDGPRFVEVSDDPGYVVQTAQFQFVASMPYLYHKAVRCLDEEPLIGAQVCSLATPEWNEEGTFVIEITNTGTTAANPITVTGQLSLDGSCPVDAPGDSVPPTFAYEIPALDPEDRIVIDGTRRQALYYDASTKAASSALPYMQWTGAFPWPDVGVCSTMCLSVEESGSGGDAVVTVDSYLRSL